jgi:hypothetical protein
MPAGATYEPIATTTISGSNTSTVTFSNIGSYTDIIVICNVIGATNYASLFLRFNGDTGSNYSHSRIEGNGSGASFGYANNINRMQIGWPYQGTGTDKPSFVKAHILNYGGSTSKTVLSESANDQNGTGDVARYVGLWRSTSAITSITIDTGAVTGIKVGSMFTLYGITRA